MLKNNNESGIFIAFEGIDGSGKSTQAALLAERLMADGFNCYKTEEPTGSPIGMLIRSYIAEQDKTDERAIAALFAADRLDHLLAGGGILEKVKNGAIVITDRYYLSSYAYQSTAMPLEWVMGLNSQSARLLKPDCHIYIDVSPETALKRISDGRERAEIFETLGRLTNVRKKYFEIFDTIREEENIIIVDGEASEEKVADCVWNIVNHLIAEV